MRVIFLDIDGVLNQLQSFKVDEKCVKELSKLNSSDVRIVLSSSWRMGYDRDMSKCSPQVQNLRRVLQKYNMDISYKTDKLGDRRKEILSWLKGKNISNYIVLDDDKLEYSSISDLNIYIVDFKTGLTSKDIVCIRKRFGW